MYCRPHFSVLVVENDEDDRFLVQRAFAGIGFDRPVHMASTAAEAIAYLEGQKPFSNRAVFPYPSLIMIDLEMPVADGFAVLEYLRAHPESAIIPTVVFSGSNDPYDVKKSYLCGASAYHEKPQDFHELQALLRSLLDYWMRCCVPEVDSGGRQLPVTRRKRLTELAPEVI